MKPDRVTWNWKKDIFHPVFCWGMNEECPYIWIGWWLISFDPFKERDFPAMLKTISISFMPD